MPSPVRKLQACITKILKQRLIKSCLVINTRISTAIPALRYMILNYAYANNVSPQSRPTSRRTSAALLTTVADNEQFEEVIVVPGHAGEVG